MNLHQLFDAESSTYTYLLLDTLADAGYLATVV